MTAPDLFGASPFDAIHQTREDGSEFWSARDLMPLLGYSAWRNLEVPIQRAMKAAGNQGHDVEQHFAGSRKVAASGPDATDYHLSRFAAYLVAMNGDPNKPEVAAAQAYFAVKTREAEVAPAVDLATITRRDLALMIVAAEDERDAAVARAEVAETQVKELEPAAQAWHDVTNAEGSWSANEAAQLLRNAGMMTGQNRLLQHLDAIGWTFVRGGLRHINQKAADAGLLVARAYAPRYKPNGERIQMAPQIRITGKGLDRLIRDSEAA